MKWVSIYGNAQSKVTPHPAKYAKDVTLRYPIYIPFEGDKLSIRLENFCGDEDVKIESVVISKGHSLSDKQTDDIRNLTFNGSYACEMKAHGSIISDVIDYHLEEDEYLIISMYLKEFTNLTSGVNITGPLSKGYFAYGNQTLNNELDLNTSMKTNWVYFLTNVDLYTSDENYAIICYGDSITSQDWPDYMQLELKERNINNVAVIRKAVSGTRILREYACIPYQSYGLKGENRFIHEIEHVKGAKTLIIQHGINDIIHPVGTDVNIFRPLSDMPTLDELKDGMKYYLEHAKRFNLDTYVGTLVPIYNWRTYAIFRENIKNEFNQYLLTLPSIDFNNAIGELIDEAYHFKDGCDSGDHLHPSKLAYKLMAIKAVDTLFNNNK